MEYRLFNLSSYPTTSINKSRYIRTMLGVDPEQKLTVSAINPTVVTELPGHGIVESRAINGKMKIWKTTCVCMVDEDDQYGDVKYKNMIKMRPNYFWMILKFPIVNQGDTFVVPRHPTVVRCTHEYVKETTEENRTIRNLGTVLSNENTVLQYMRGDDQFTNSISGALHYMIENRLTHLPVEHEELLVLAEDNWLLAEQDKWYSLPASEVYATLPAFDVLPENKVNWCYHGRLCNFVACTKGLLSVSLLQGNKNSGDLKQAMGSLASGIKVILKQWTSRMTIAVMDALKWVGQTILEIMKNVRSYDFTQILTNEESDNDEYDLSFDEDLDESCADDSLSNIDHQPNQNNEGDHNVIVNYSITSIPVISAALLKMMTAIASIFWKPSATKTEQTFGAYLIKKWSGKGILTKETSFYSALHNKLSSLHAARIEKPTIDEIGDRLHQQVEQTKVSLRRKATTATTIILAISSILVGSPITFVFGFAAMLTNEYVQQSSALHALMMLCTATNAPSTMVSLVYSIYSIAYGNENYDDLMDVAFNAAIIFTVFL